MVIAYPGKDLFTFYALLSAAEAIRTKRQLITDERHWGHSSDP